MNRPGRISRRVAIGACGPIALTAISGAVTPASAMDQTVGIACTFGNGSLTAYETYRSGNNIVSGAKADCSLIGGATNIQLTVAVQKYSNGDWVNVETVSSSTYGTTLSLTATEVNGCTGHTQYTDWRTATFVTAAGQTYGITSTGIGTYC
ncbi:hypothetical protein FrEUN1fDRAFT_2003 [Parafrankia sp. EUN1f]|nr:hypothetical protein FrEUN1fDRAFT_2003 [Parafrankia sp. EUN1f]